MCLFRVKMDLSNLSTVEFSSKTVKKKKGKTEKKVPSEDEIVIRNK